MLTTCKLNSASQAIAYHQRDYGEAAERYYSETSSASEWIGPMAAELGLSGEIAAEPYKMLANGRSPDGKQLVRFKKPSEYEFNGKRVRSARHTVGQDLTFSAPQSFSAAAILGKDSELRKAHEEAVKVAMNEVGRYVQARLAHNRAETTGVWVAALFHHDSARPVGDFASVNLHSHCVLFNMTRTADGKTRAMQTHELYRSKSLGTAVYRAELARRATALGYQIIQGKYGQPEIAGYSPELLEALAVRSKQIAAYQETHPKATGQVAAHRTRQPKIDLSAEELFAKNMALAREHGVDPEMIRQAAQEAMLCRLSPAHFVARAAETANYGHKVGPYSANIAPLTGGAGRGSTPQEEHGSRFAELCVTYAIAKNYEREAVVDERRLIEDALIRGLGEVGVGEIKVVLDGRLESGQLIDLERQVMQHGRMEGGAGNLWVAAGNSSLGSDIHTSGSNRQTQEDQTVNTLRSRLTTAKMLEMERSNLAFVEKGQGTQPRLISEASLLFKRNPLVDDKQLITNDFLFKRQPPDTPDKHADYANVPSDPSRRILEVSSGSSVKSGRHPLTPAQLQAVEELAKSRDRVVALVGTAGSGKSAALRAVRRGAELDGFVVLGMAPTSRAAAALGESAGIRNPITVQAFLQQKDTPEHDKRLLMVDEASLASTQMIHELWKRLGPEDRVILVGDPRQHQSVEAGRFFEAALDNGMLSVRLDSIMRQKDAELRRAIELLAQGRFQEGLRDLGRQGRIHEVQNPAERVQAIAGMAAGMGVSAQNTLVISPDNATRKALNEAIRTELQAAGLVAAEEHTVKTLVQRSELTGADRGFAALYAPGDVIRYSKGSRILNLRSGEYTRVVDVNRSANLLTVERANGTRVEYDPSRLQGVNVAREQELKLAIGDRIQMTAPFKAKHVTNRDLGTVEKVDAAGSITLKLDSKHHEIEGLTIQFHISEHPEIDYGYASTSHSSQGLTAVGTILHVDTEKSKYLVNQRLGYTALSRAAERVDIFTDCAKDLPEKLGRYVTKEAALERATDEQVIHKMGFSA